MNNQMELENICAVCGKHYDKESNMWSDMCVECSNTIPL